ncbi:MAG: hypothetical protein R2716_00465 [Microthrixaceae bacterium]
MTATAICRNSDTENPMIQRMNESLLLIAGSNTSWPITEARMTATNTPSTNMMKGPTFSVNLFQP